MWRISLRTSPSLLFSSVCMDCARMGQKQHNDEGWWIWFDQRVSVTMRPEMQTQGLKTEQKWELWHRKCITSCRQQGKQQLPHLRGRVSLITSSPVLSRTWRTNERRGPQSCLLQKSVSSDTKNTCCPVLFFTLYLLLLSQSNTTVRPHNKRKRQVTVLVKH